MGENFSSGNAQFHNRANNAVNRQYLLIHKTQFFYLFKAGGA